MKSQGAHTEQFCVCMRTWLTIAKAVAMLRTEMGLRQDES